MSASTMNELFQFDEGAGLLLAPRPDGTVELIAMIHSTKWSALVEAAKVLGPR
jgi:hypothetical protein